MTDEQIERRKAKQREYYNANKEKIYQKQKEYRHSDKGREVVKKINDKYYSKKRKKQD